MILLVDNYDSFTYNLAQIIGELTDLKVLRNDDKSLYTVADQADGIIFSPGPGRSDEAGELENMIRRYYDKKPLLGICLGHQAIGEVFGGTVTHATTIRHGKVSTMLTTAPSALFTTPKTDIMRYHSLIVKADRLPKEFVITGQSADDHEVMAMQHRWLPVFGLQFHPESIGTPEGAEMIRKFAALTQTSN
ncbi:anthranilate synthase component II [Leuconostoc rapi]|uniref:anthranilate synthase component II n=1 Tax=Leuconostoc rapi TaxID=1406906 RepID=UPI00195EF289|nr:aminodeoxychorismate/anthranilate synthase component II [Leuconostoc rapi]MBM7435015.1 anthranilate synthase component 2 [Leuconostoc rapi]